MTVLSLVFLSFAVASQALSPRASTAATCTKTYTVKYGDTCNKIEKANGLSVGTVISLNGVVNSGCTNLWSGQAICIGSGVSSTSATPSSQNTTCTAVTVTGAVSITTITITANYTPPPVTTTPAAVTVTQAPVTATVTNATTTTVTVTM
ncbi:hypothetical protein L218DRAFT_71883 [Marasmius fiardii PR-910]|nr:hypothetical protein L218DRAFT_71883 [Marasmius fiardii PR-910]